MCNQRQNADEEIGQDYALSNNRSVEVESGGRKTGLRVTFFAAFDAVSNTSDAGQHGISSSDVMDWPGIFSSRSILDSVCELRLLRRVNLFVLHVTPSTSTNQLAGCSS